MNNHLHPCCKHSCKQTKAVATSLVWKNEELRRMVEGYRGALERIKHTPKKVTDHMQWCDGNNDNPQCTCAQEIARQALSPAEDSNGGPTK